MSKGNRPVHEVRLGTVKASIWENVYGDNTRHSVTFLRSYKDKEGDQWKTTESFNRDDLLILAKVIDRAHAWIWDNKAAPARPE